ncbi:MAG: hypothetical protein ACOWYE_08100 [Desulfatiglandales bacterium]
MTRIEELIEICSKDTYRASYLKAKAESLCIRCGNRIEGFRSASARLEYSISALCQRCQDEIFLQ